MRLSHNEVLIQIIFKVIFFVHMLDANTKKACKDDPSIREIKIRNIEHAIEQAELMIKESKMSQEELIFLKRKISDSRQDLEILYLMKIQ